VTSRRSTRQAVACLALSLAFVVAGCSSDDTKTTAGPSTSAGASGAACTASAGSFKIGHVYSTSPSFPAALQYQKGFEAYFQALNDDKGGVSCKKVEVTSVDNQGTAQGTLAAYQTLKTNDALLAITGFDASSNAAPVVEQASRDQIPLILGVTTLRAATTPVQPYIFAMAEVGRDSYTAMVLEAKKLNLLKVATLLVDGPEGRDTGPYLEDLMRKQGMDPVSTQYINQTGTLDFTANIAQAKSKGAQVVVSVFGPAGYLAMKKAMDAQQLDVPIIAHSTGLSLSLMQNWPSGKFVPESPFTIDNSAPGFAAVAAAAKKYKQLDDVPAPFIAGWIGGKALAKALENCGVDCKRADLPKAIEKLGTFDTQGLSLPLTFSATDHYAPNGAKFYQLGPDGKIAQLTDFLPYSG
jgi:branched-chain amino acid transport system substrate-binding protein